MILKSFKDIFATLPGCVNNRRRYSMRFCSCTRAKTTTHPPIYPEVAQRSLLLVRAALWTGFKFAFYENIRFCRNSTLACMTTLRAPPLSPGILAVTFSVGRSRTGELADVLGG